MMSRPPPLTIGVDLGGTKILTALVDSSGNPLAFKRQPTNPGKGPKRIIADIIGCVRDCLGRGRAERKSRRYWSGCFGPLQSSRRLAMTGAVSLDKLRVDTSEGLLRLEESVRG